MSVIADWTAVGCPMTPTMEISATIAGNSASTA